MYITILFGLFTIIFFFKSNIECAMFSKTCYFLLITLCLLGDKTDINIYIFISNSGNPNGYISKC